MAGNRETGQSILDTRIDFNNERFNRTYDAHAWERKYINLQRALFQSSIPPENVFLELSDAANLGEIYARLNRVNASEALFAETKRIYHDRVTIYSYTWAKQETTEAGKAGKSMYPEHSPQTTRHPKQDRSSVGFEIELRYARSHSR